MVIVVVVRATSKPGADDGSAAHGLISERWSSVSASLVSQPGGSVPARFGRDVAQKTGRTRA